MEGVMAPIAHILTLGLLLFSCDMGAHRKAKTSDTDLSPATDGYTPFDRNTIVEARILKKSLGEGHIFQSSSEIGIVSKKDARICLHLWSSLETSTCHDPMDHYPEGDEFKTYSVFSAPSTMLSWNIIDRFDPANWNIAFIEVWDNEKVLAKSEEFVVRNLKQDQTKLIYVSPDRLLLSDDQTLLSLKREGDKITHTLLKDPALLSEFLFRSENEFYTRPKANHLDLIEIKDSQVLKTGLSFETLDPLAVLKNNGEQAVFVGESISLAQGVKAGFLIEIEWQDSPEELIEEIKKSSGVLSEGTKLISVPTVNSSEYYEIEIGQKYKIDRMRHKREAVAD
jgi:hypothetical protein